MPQARQGENGVCALVVAGSKFAGSAFENEHIGHIQVIICDLVLVEGDESRL